MRWCARPRALSRARRQSQLVVCGSRGAALCEKRWHGLLDELLAEARAQQRAARAAELEGSRVLATWSQQLTAAREAVRQANRAVAAAWRG